MTRINLVPPKDLIRQHLIAEYRELPRIFGLAKKWHQRTGGREDLPQSYVLGTGHVRFFYDKLEWLTRRQKNLVREMLRRGYSVTFSDPEKLLEDAPIELLHDWKPSEQEIELSRQRLESKKTGLQ